MAAGSPLWTGGAPRPASDEVLETTMTIELAARVRGPVLTPDDDAYDEERSGFQTAWRHRPAVAVGATGPADVQAAVAYAARHGLPVAVQATGHGLSVPG